MARPSYAQLRAFNAVARERSFSRAAAALGVTQPAVTAQIRSLEEAFRVRLFERTGQGVQLTALGQRLFEQTDAIREVEDRAAEILSASFALAAGEIRVAAGAPAPTMRLVAEFGRRYPGVRVTTTFGAWDEVVAAIRTREADIGILTEAPKERSIAALSYLRQRIVALVPEGHRLAAARQLSLRDLEREPVVFRTGQSLTQKTLERRLAELGLTVAPILLLETREAIYEAVAQGLGIGFMFDAASTRLDGVRRVAVRELPDSYSEDVFCLADHRGLRTHEAFFEMAASLGAALRDGARR
ncbi:transcriptional regulator, LysR family [Tistlia consotensis]|uniref:Transcriptional regulator, LysR family n=1 Tax=Tistlia consotensis USBA 355 TaxID=560819 RepID=A0A1Y6B9U0_9PROT|nr:LysR family transcriptional regulator [Tistlia consotensis]SMF00518.1 transcriptional regulator, LysR family [Tistlia consotensis USBA 355]SNR75741.1 transcriptional regulator, LysR family [Tistlia consotensis]